MENWKKYIFENEHETLFETDNMSEMVKFLSDFSITRDELIMTGNIYESDNYITIHFYGYNLMIKK